MIACFDVHYEENTAYVAALVFENWSDSKPKSEYTVELNPVAEYIPGQFYKRELPGLLKCFESIEEEVDCIIVDSFVWLEEGRKGMGAYLYESLEQKTPVIGVGKTNFRSALNVEEIYRGQSQKPLYVSSVGTDLLQAAANIKSMHGLHRIPTLLKSVDQLCRTFWH